MKLKNYLIKIFLCLPFCVLITYSNVASADNIPNYKRETNIDRQILGDIFDGEVEKITSNLNESFSIIRYSSLEKEKAILLLHGRGLNPNEENVMQPLRVGLFEEGYNTFSIQLPVLDKGKTFYDYRKIFKYSDERINSSIKKILNSNKEVIIIAHSCGVHMLMSWVRKHHNNSVKAFISIGSEAVDIGQKIIHPYPYNKIKTPILDVYGENDYKSIKRNAGKRLSDIKNASNNKSSQVKIFGSDHYHRDNADELFKAVNQWLKTL